MVQLDRILEHPSYFGRFYAVCPIWAIWDLDRVRRLWCVLIMSFERWAGADLSIAAGAWLVSFDQIMVYDVHSMAW